MYTDSGMERLRDKIETELYAAAFGGIPEMILSIDAVRNASYEELIEMARTLGMY